MVLRNRLFSKPFILLAVVVALLSGCGGGGGGLVDPVIPPAPVVQPENLQLMRPEQWSQIDVAPEFQFSGPGDMDYYVLNLYEQSEEEDKEIFSAKVTGEALSVDGEEQSYLVKYDGERLLPDINYKWQVKGYKNDEFATETERFFTYNDGDCYLSIAPDGFSPANYSSTKISKPEFLWKSDSCAEYYIVRVFRTYSDEEVMNEVSTENEIDYKGIDLADGVVYSWHVTAVDAYGGQKKGKELVFIKESMSPVYEPPIPVWNSAQGKTPIVAGNKYVSLNWEQVDDTRVVGYAVYRELLLSDFDSSKSYKIIHFEDLDDPKPDENCPELFSEANPGFCDIEVENGQKYFYWVACIQLGDTPGHPSSPQGVTVPNASE